MRQCPYCGSEDLGMIDILGASYAVGCRNCGMTGPQSDSKDGALSSWNGLCAHMCNHCISRPWGKAMARRIARLAKESESGDPSNCIDPRR